MRVLSYAREVGVWLWDKRTVGFGLILLGVVLWLCSRAGWSEGSIRVGGLVLQLLGIGTVAFGIHVTRKLFGQPGVFSAFALWIRRFPRWRVKRVNGGETIAGVGGITLSGSGVIGTVASSLEERVASLERRVGEVEGSVGEVRREVADRDAAHAAALADERVAREEEDAVIRGRLEAASTGGLTVSAVGAMWLLVGVTMSTVPAEISRLLG